MAFFKRTPKISKADHDAAMAVLANLAANLEQERDEALRQIKAYRALALQRARKIGELQAENEVLRVDADKYRRSRANLKQFRKPVQQEEMARV